MRYLVTGGAGVIGSLIVKRLLECGHAVAVIDSMEEARNRWIVDQFKTPIDLYTGRMEERGQGALNAIVECADAVIHCAAFTGIPQSVIDPSDDWRSNVDATRVLLEALRLTPRPTVVLSSIKPYRVLPMPDHGLDESTVLEPDEPYAASKAAQSMLCQAYARSYGLPVVTFRCSNLYGPAPCHGPRHGWMTWMAISAAIGRPLEVQGTGEQTRDMLHAGDVYTACLAGLAKASLLRGEVFNLGGGADNRVSVNQVADTLRELTGVAVHRGPARAMDDDHVFVSTAKFLRATEWRPAVDAKRGLLELLTWAQRNAGALSGLYKDV